MTVRSIIKQEGIGITISGEGPVTQRQARDIVDRIEGIVAMHQGQSPAEGGFADEGRAGPQKDQDR